MIDCVVTFAEDVQTTPKAVPHFHYHIETKRFGCGLRDSGLYHRIMQYTGNHELAAGVENWAEVAAIGETYEADELTAEIVEY